jgi:predicted metal-dependent phosphoesterase TrpH
MLSDQFEQKRAFQKVDFHCHTNASKDCMVEINALLKTARQRGLDKLAITDHNTIKGALRAKEIDPELVIVGEEIFTTSGELLAFFVTNEIPSRLEPMEVIKRLKDMGAFISVSHPFDHMRHGWSEKDLEMILPHIDAVEIFNARAIRPAINLKAIEFAKENNLLGTVGSDAHSLPEVGIVFQKLAPFSDAKSLRTSLKNAEFSPIYSSGIVRLSSIYAKMTKRWLKRKRWNDN